MKFTIEFSYGLNDAEKTAMRMTNNTLDRIAYNMMESGYGVLEEDADDVMALRDVITNILDDKPIIPRETK